MNLFTRTNSQARVSKLKPSPDLRSSTKIPSRASTPLAFAYRSSPSLAQKSAVKQRYAPSVISSVTGVSTMHQPSSVVQKRDTPNRISPMLVSQQVPPGQSRNARKVAQGYSCIATQAGQSSLLAHKLIDFGTEPDQIASIYHQKNQGRSAFISSNPSIVDRTSQASSQEMRKNISKTRPLSVWQTRKNSVTKLGIQSTPGVKSIVQSTIAASQSAPWSPPVICSQTPAVFEITGEGDNPSKEPVLDNYSVYYSQELSMHFNEIRNKASKTPAKQAPRPKSVLSRTHTVLHTQESNESPVSRRKKGYLSVSRLSQTKPAVKADQSAKTNQRNPYVPFSPQILKALQNSTAKAEQQRSHSDLKFKGPSYGSKISHQRTKQAEAKKKPEEIPIRSLKSQLRIDHEFPAEECLKSYDASRLSTPAQQEPAPKFRLSKSTKRLNLVVETHQSLLSRLKDRQADPNSDLAEVDMESELQVASKKIKAMQFQCKNMVSRDNEHIVTLILPETGTGAKGDPRRVEVLEDSFLVCRVKIHERKAPLVIHLRHIVPHSTKPKSVQRAERYWENIGKATHLLKEKSGSKTRQAFHVYEQQLVSPVPTDLKAYVSFDYKGQMAKGPSLQAMTKIIIKKPPSANKPSVIGPANDYFLEDFVYVGFSSLNGCIIDLTCQFPQEEVKAIAEEPSKSKLIGDKVKEMKKNAHKMDEVLSRLKNLKQKEPKKNFIQVNTEVRENLEVQNAKRTLAKLKMTSKLLQAQEKRSSQQQQKWSKGQFDLIKWQLYRVRVDQIEDDYANFKRTQKRIFQWLQILLRHTSLRKTASNFEAHKEAVVTRQVRWWKHFKIAFHFKRYLCKIAMDKGRRDLLQVKRSFEAMTPSLKPLLEKRAGRQLIIFLRETNESWKIKDALRKFYAKVQLIQKAILTARGSRENRMKLLDSYFDKEKTAMVKHYSEKARRLKKYRTAMTSVQALQPWAKDLILNIYYFNKISSQNLINAIYYHSNVCLERGQRGQPGEEDYGMLTDQEHRSLKALFRNIKAADKFLFKGTKDVPIIGQDEPILLTHTSENRVTVGSDALDFSSLLAIIAPKLMKEESTEQRTILMGGGILQDAEKHSLSAGKGKGKAKTSKKGSAHSSPSRKSTKKVKKDDVIVDRAIPRGRTRGFNLFRPDRATMQRLISRAAALKPDEEPPVLEDVIPWVKVHNADLD